MKKSILLLLFLYNCMESQAQEKKHLPLTFSIVLESIRLPTQGLKNIKFHPGFKIGTELYYHSRQKSTWVQTVNLIYYYHRSMHQAVGVYSEFGYRRGGIKGLNADILLGAGYLYQHLDQASYRANNNGDFKVIRHPSLHRFLTSLSVGTGYALPSANKNSPTQISLRYQLLGESPFNKEVPLLPHSILHVGVTFPFIQK